MASLTTALGVSSAAASHARARGSARASVGCPAIAQAPASRVAGVMRQITTRSSFIGVRIEAAAPSRAPIRRGRAGAAGVVVAEQEVDELPKELQKIVMAFKMVPDPMQRYKQLLYFASKLPSMPAEAQVPENKVEGCVSQVWVLPTIKEDGLVYFQAESDSQLTKGLAALLCQGLSGSTPKEILSVQPEFIEMLGLKGSLTPSRNNGFLNMLLKMQKATLEAVARQEGAGGAAAPPAAEEAEEVVEEVDVDPSRPVYSSMVRKLKKELSPTLLDVKDESAQHAGHAGRMEVKGDETHFAVRIVSDAFDGLKTVKRHRLVYAILDAELKGTVHALSLDTKTPSE